METYFENINWDGVYEALSEAIEAMKKIIKQLVEVVGEVFSKFWNALREFLKQTNPHLFHLAYNHKKSRTRKKNIKRLWRIFQRKGGAE